MLGLRHGENYLVAYSEQWPVQYAAEREHIVDAIGEHVCAIEHVGSTAVPGLSAKPIIDIAVRVADLSVADSLATSMAAIGYDYPGDIGIPDHRIFGRDRDVRYFLVHILEIDSYRWHELVTYRDRLRADPELVARYEQVKQAAVELHPTGRAEYNEAKAAFIRSVLDGESR